MQFVAAKCSWHPVLVNVSVCPEEEVVLAQAAPAPVLYLAPLLPAGREGGAEELLALL